ncbi:hypothetical protein G9A89_008538 [Geosiphon pyriformis]|nr:hypothetical protein G9A89_008538 [Geosiphon pyriformis]
MSVVLCLLSAYSSDIGLFTVVCKNFVLRNWYAEAALAFEEKRKTALTIAKFVKFVVKLFHTKVWLVRFKHRVNMERAGLVKNGSMVLGLSYCLVSNLSDGVVHLLGVIEFYTVNFGRHRLCYFFSGLSDDASVYIDV